MFAGYTTELVSAQSDGTALTNTAVAGSIIPTQAQYSLPANFLQLIGQELILQASGRISTLATTPGTLTFQFKFGASTVVQTQALPLNVNAKTNVTWWLEWAMTLRAVGTSTSNFMHTGWFASEAVIGSPTAAVGGSGLLLIPASAPAVGSNFSNTVANQANLFAQWSVADPANSIQLHQYRLFCP